MNSKKMQHALVFLDKWLERQKLLQHQVPGFVVSISHKGNVVYNKAFGYANLANKEQMTVDHLFRIASHSKTFTATAIMQLVEQGKLKLSDHASLYLPFLKENPDERLHKVTIQQMLSHSSGISRDGENIAFWGVKAAFPKKEDVEVFFREKPLVIENNTRFKYSNFAYGLLGWIIEEVSGQTYAEYMEKNIFQPLKLEKIGAEYDENASPYVTGYTAMTPLGVQAPISSHVDTGDIAGATSFYANSDAMCKFYSAMMIGSGQLLNDESKKEMFRLHWPVLHDAEGAGYGLGFKCDKVGGRQLNGHGGGMPGNITRTYFDSKDQLVIVLLTNSHAMLGKAFQGGIWHILDTFEEEYDENSAYIKCEGEVFSIWGDSYYIPMAGKIYETSLGSLQPFSDCAQLEHVECFKFKYVKESGYGSYGEVVEFILNDHGLERIKFGEYDLMNQAEYETDIHKLIENNGKLY